MRNLGGSDRVTPDLSDRRSFGVLRTHRLRAQHVADRPKDPVMTDSLLLRADQVVD